MTVYDLSECLPKDECKHENIVPYGDGRWGRCESCGDDSFPITEDYLEEGFGSIAQSKLKDLATGFILKARPIVIMHHIDKDHTITYKLKRGLLKHTLMVNEGSGDRTLETNISAMYLIGKALRAASKMLMRGYVEI